MHYESIIYKSKNNSFDDFIKVETYKLSNGEIQIDKLPATLNPNSFKNIFVYDGYEFNILKRDENVYKISIYKPELNLSAKSNLLKFGCELETCLNLECIEPLTNNIMENFRKLQTTQDKNIWKDLIIIYIQEVIVKYASPKFKELFTKICIAIDPKSNLTSYIIDVYTGIVEKYNEVNYNRYITFTRDSSLVCNDGYKKSIFSKYKYIKENTIHCEIITPTLSSIDELEILYKSIVNPRCLNYNPSTAFHVNLSFIKPVYFSFGLCDEIIKNYKDFEDDNYRIKENKDESKYAPMLFNTMIYNILKNIGTIIYHGEAESYRYNETLFLDEGYYRSYINFNEKYSSLYCKSNRLIEFRLFSSDNEVKNLMEYLRDSITLMKNSYENYRNNFNKSFGEFQDINLKTGIDFSPLEYYEGPLYSEESDFPRYNDINNLSKSSEMILALTQLFAKRRQQFIDINNKDKSKLIIFVSKDENIYTYYLTKLDENNFKIELDDISKIRN